ncbi:MAG: MTH1187 family thiamine-binding protein [Bacteroidota bacterium]
MSVLMQFAMFPTDKGASASPYVSRVIAMIRDSELPYQLSAMGTIIETETLEEAQSVVNKAYSLLQNDCSRVYCTVTFDIREGSTGRMQQKINSIEEKIGKVNH